MIKFKYIASSLVLSSLIASLPATIRADRKKPLFVDDISATNGLIRTYVENQMNLASSIASNTVETVLAPQYLEFECDGEKEKAFIVPNWAMSPFRFTTDGTLANDWTGTSATIYSNGPLRNYSVLVEEMPDDEYVRRYGAFIMDFTSLTNNVQRVYASPAFKPVDWQSENTPPELCRGYGWRITTNDIPCLVSLRQPEASTIIVTLQRLGKAPLEEKIAADIAAATNALATVAHTGSYTNLVNRPLEFRACIDADGVTRFRLFSTTP